jgi:DNA-binding transcriptional LysR family regulator
VPRHLNLRQIEAFKAVIEIGTVSRAAELLHISQSALSKLIAHLEADSGLKLFDRLKGRLAPTEHAMLLYEEVGRIFAGVRQIENATEAIRRRQQGRLSIGVMPALAGSFIQRAMVEFLNKRPNVFCSIQSLSSQWIVDWLVTRKLDVGLVEPGLDNPYVTFEPIMEHSLVCIMPPDHPLATKNELIPQDFEQVPFVTVNPDSYIGHRIEALFEAHKVKPNIVLVANLTQTVCELVAAGLGVSLVHPLVVSGFENRLVVRRFEPEVPFHFQLCRSADSRNAAVTEQFVQELRATAVRISRSMLKDQ